MAEKPTRREILKTILASIVLPLLPKRRTEPLVPQPKPGVELACQTYGRDWVEDGWFVLDVAQAYDTTFWDAPKWAEDYELINGIWYWA